jgi:hypothetical protein
MLESWWDAHAFEFAVAAVVIGLCAVIGLVESVSDAIKERKQKRKDGLL